MELKFFLLNTRLTKRSYKRYRDFSLGRKLFQSIHWIGTQSEKNREQLIDLGVDANRVVAIGNIKALAMLDDKQKSAQTQWHSWREEHNFCWVAGSVHEGEVLDILNAHSSLMKIEKIKPLLIMTPRKPEEFSEIILMVKGFCVEQKWKVKILSEESHPISEEIDILIVDQMGHLSQIYAIADVAFVGGSLIPYGGHNILEPAMYSIPIISGPYHYDQIPIYSVFLANDAVIICKDSEDLTQALNNTLDKTFVKKISQQINKSVDDIQASIDKNLQSFYAQLEDILN